MAETVLVTGGTGFVAGWCIVELLQQGYDVRTTIRRPDGEAQVRAAVAPQVDPGDRLSFAIANLTDDDGWATALDGCTSCCTWPRRSGPAPTPTRSSSRRSRERFACPGPPATPACGGSCTRRAAAEHSVELAALVPLLGQRRWATAAKAERVLGWQSRPWTETILASARSLLALGS